MHWQKLIEASELFRKDDQDEKTDGYYNAYYDAYMKERKPDQWEADTGPSDDEVARLFRFLNQWRTRYQDNKGSQGQFRDAYLRVLKQLRLLKGYSLVEARLDSQVADGKTLSETIQEVFETLASAGKKHQWTGASKVLHVLQPRMFVMWDTAIRGGYAIKDGSESSDYASWFLRRMQCEAREAVDSFVAETKLERRVAVPELEKLGGGRPITKLLDEYNYCKFRVRCPELWE